MKTALIVSSVVLSIQNIAYIDPVSENPEIGPVCSQEVKAVPFLNKNGTLDPLHW